VALSAVDQRPGLAADVVAGEQRLVAVFLEQIRCQLMVRVAPSPQGEPERRIDEDQRRPP